MPKLTIRSILITDRGMEGQIDHDYRQATPLRMM